MITNVHERVVAMSPERVWELVERVAEPDGVLWPSNHWPPMRFDRPLAVGAIGGHGPIRYNCVGLEAGKSVTFEFAPSSGLRGTHSLTVEPGPREGTCLLRHEIRGRAGLAAKLRWVLVIRWLHDVVVEEMLDNAELAAGQPPARPVRWSVWVRLIRRVMMPAAPVEVAR